jgi:hypothetical protein
MRLDCSTCELRPLTPADAPGGKCAVTLAGSSRGLE